MRRKGNRKGLNTVRSDMAVNDLFYFGTFLDVFTICLDIFLCFLTFQWKVNQVGARTWKLTDLYTNKNTSIIVMIITWNNLYETTSKNEKRKNSSHVLSAWNNLTPNYQLCGFFSPTRSWQGLKQRHGSDTKMMWYWRLWSGFIPSLVMLDLEQTVNLKLHF